MLKGSSFVATTLLFYKPYLCLDPFAGCLCRPPPALCCFSPTPFHFSLFLVGVFLKFLDLRIFILLISRFCHWWDNFLLSTCSSCKETEFGSEHTGWFAIVCNSVYRESAVFFWSSQLSVPCAQTQTHTVWSQTWDKRPSVYLTYQSECWLLYSPSIPQLHPCYRALLDGIPCPLP